MPTAKQKAVSALEIPKEKLKEAQAIAEEAVAEITNTAKQAAEENLDIGKDKIDMYAAEASYTIAKNPIASVACAFVAGWAISKLLK